MENLSNKVSNRQIGRDSNIELLRVVAILMIVMSHIIVHTFNSQLTYTGSVAGVNHGSFNFPIFYEKLIIPIFIMPIGIVGNVIFILISGYFNIGNMVSISGAKDSDGYVSRYFSLSHTKITQISKKLILQVGFASIFLTLVPTLIYLLNQKERYLNLISITNFNSMSWFVGYYFLIILLGSIFLDRILSSLDFEKYTAVLIIFFAIFSFGWSGGLIDNIAEGLRRLLSGIFVYSLGGYIRKYDVLNRFYLRTIFIVIILVYALLFVSFYNLTQTNIENYLSKGSEGMFYQTTIVHANHGIVPIILGVSMFELFRRISIPKNKVINFLGKSTLMVYLIHDNQFFYSLWNGTGWVAMLYYNPLLFILKLLQWTLITFLMGLIAYIMYDFSLRILKKYRNIFVK